MSLMTLLIDGLEKLNREDEKIWDLVGMDSFFVILEEIWSLCSMFYVSKEIPWSESGPWLLFNEP